MKDFLSTTNISKINYFDESSEFSYEVIEDLASQFSSCRGIADASQQGICIQLERGAFYIACILAAWKAGFYVIPLNTQWPEMKNQGIASKVQPALIVLEDDAEVKSDEFNIATRSELMSGLGKDHTRSEMRDLHDDDLAYIIFTSGSTGEPKGVVISVRSYRHYIDWTRRYFAAYGNLERLLLTSELTFDITMGDIAFALAFGTDIGVAVQHANIPYVLSMIMKFKIDVLYSVPTTHLAVTGFTKKKKGADLSSLKLILSGGDKFSWDLVSDYKALAQNAHFYNVYGPTEVTINCFSVRLDNMLSDPVMLSGPVPIGKCFDSLEYILVAEDEFSDREGELCIAGTQIMIGYHNDPERTQEVITKFSQFDKAVYRTGDLAYLNGDLIYLKGRVDHLVKIKGYRIHPDEVSRALDSFDEVEASAVIAVAENDSFKLVAWVKLAQNLATESIIREKLSLLLPAYMAPEEFIIIDRFPLNQSGKIDKNTLEHLYK